MRYSLILASAIGGAVLLGVTACTPPTPVKGTVVEKEHKPATKGSTKKTCTKTAATEDRPSKKTCSTSVSGAKAECYELEIRTADGDEVEVCDKAAYLVLDLDDLYDSSQDYSREDQ